MAPTAMAYFAPFETPSEGGTTGAEGEAGGGAGERGADEDEGGAVEGFFKYVNGTFTFFDKLIFAVLDVILLPSIGANSSRKL